jgi:hypothetical protein
MQIPKSHKRLSLVGMAATVLASCYLGARGRNSCVPSSPSLIVID